MCVKEAKIHVEAKSPQKNIKGSEHKTHLPYPFDQNINNSHATNFIHLP